ncbi:hypothetical protein JZO66_00075 [Enterococcus sp. DIV0242_7C1]|uniref:Uncharacterized protein n=1 Tax=Candidatus Enterococcus dunnyi TaxID=1834192 RepID=A0A200JFX6_9ENTE|nr:MULTISPECIES: hypothetical protein [unclassified Enterococcus]MBO0468921.1 hypothetical protein [Enterococcus sp. DIV0242_7C1]OUZ35791.1 hypothetical protein A5889_001267 [Enterococcus sp. 9D6_DIV0238]
MRRILRIGVVVLFVLFLIKVNSEDNSDIQKPIASSAEKTKTSKHDKPTKFSTTSEERENPEVPEITNSVETVHVPTEIESPSTENDQSFMDEASAEEEFKRLKQEFSVLMKQAVSTEELAQLKQEYNEAVAPLRDLVNPYKLIDKLNEFKSYLEEKQIQLENEQTTLQQ